MVFARRGETNHIGIGVYMTMLLEAQSKCMDEGKYVEVWEVILSWVQRQSLLSQSDDGIDNGQREHL